MSWGSGSGSEGGGTSKPADWGSQVQQPGTEKSLGFNLDLTSGGRAATRAPLYQQTAAALKVPLPVKRTLTDPAANPFKPVIEPRKILKRNPFIIALNAFGLNVPGTPTE